MEIPILSLAGMLFSAVLSIGAPIVLFFLARKTYGKGSLPVLLGGAGFIVFAMILEQLLHLAVLRPSADGGIALARQHPYWYMLYGCLAAGVFEETARLLSFHILKKRSAGIGVALKYGIGHGGAESILVSGVSQITNFVLAMGLLLGAEAFLAQAAGGALLKQLQVLAGTQPAMFFVSGFKRLFAIVIHISLSVIVYYAVYASRKVWLYPLAILLHALVNSPAALMQIGVLKSVWLVEGIVLLSSLALAGIAFQVHRRLQTIDPPTASESNASYLKSKV